MNAPTYVLRVSARYGREHLDTSTLPGTELGANGRGIELGLTLGELNELRSRAEIFADPDLARESGEVELCRSAQKVLEQIRRAGLWEVAGSREADAAYSVEFAAAMELRDGVKA
jgi:hypothetical protein